MLARSVVVRLAADVPRTSTHDLSQASHFAQRTLLSRNGFVVSYAALRSHAYRAALLQYRRSYATNARATKPTPKVIRDVKKAAATKPVKKAASKKAGSASSAKKAVKKQAKPKKKKTTAKPKRVAKKKELTVEEKEQARIRHYKKQALSPPHRPKGSMSAWNAYLSEALRGTTREGGPSPITKEETQLHLEKFKNLTPAEREASLEVQ
ncbi:hypothetical protein DM02DRAFT_609059 [Periconia macrospinosa]|uniref:HMG box domain-containing protein n=1 Tax=Periconia macrospinosa TaxID=97972 RepID=A0A2V1EA98_9PLEO|nr:hypothetical protein DM02DRAFT_609059 [Periconia macrospinosa]